MGWYVGEHVRFIRIRIVKGRTIRADTSCRGEMTNLNERRYELRCSFNQMQVTFEHWQQGSLVRDAAMKSVSVYLMAVAACLHMRKGVWTGRKGKMYRIELGIREYRTRGLGYQ
ncbi:hypothetical protein BHM03_00001021 [Ensete ventricosum]|nr:hypothetical protein BHM03_00001021 [Ensete ventricosum]